MMVCSNHPDFYTWGWAFLVWIQIMLWLGDEVYQVHGWTADIPTKACEPNGLIRPGYRKTNCGFSAMSCLRGRTFLLSPSSPVSQRSSSTTARQQQVAPVADIQGVDSSYYFSMPTATTTSSSAYSASKTTPRITLTRFLSHAVKDNPELRDLESLLLAVSVACKTIANLVNRAGLVWSVEQQYRDRSITGDDGNTSSDHYRQDGRFYSMKRLDQLSTIVLRNALQFSGKCHMVAPAEYQHDDDGDKPNEHQPGVLIASALDSQYVACLDPLDGSGNADASICTGTVFGVFENPQSHSSSDTDADSGDEAAASLVKAVLQPGQNMRAAGYCLYSSATVLVFTLGDDSGVHGFTLDPQIQDFVLTHPNLTIPPRGSVYSCNEANAEGWNHPGWKEYLKNLKLGQGQSQHRYAHRYVGSMVGDIHRTLLYGGLFAYPSDSIQHPNGNLQLLYKSAPMAFVVHHAGGKACNEEGTDLLHVKPTRIHEKVPVFIGSPLDIDELKGYLQKQYDQNEASVENGQ